MTITASGPLSLPFVGLAQLVASSSTFRAMVGAGSEAQALDHIYYPAVSSPSTKRPLALITTDQGNEWEMDRLGRQSGSLMLTLERAVSADVEDDYPQELLEFTNLVGAILGEMRDKANTPKAGGEHYWNATRFRQIEPPMIVGPLSDEPDVSERDYFTAAFEVSWN